MSSEPEMTKETTSGCTPLSIFYRSPRLMQVLSLLSGFGILSSGLVMAQSDTPVDTLSAPKNLSVAPAVKVAPYSPPPESAAKAKPVTRAHNIELAAPVGRKPVRASSVVLAAPAARKPLRDPGVVLAAPVARKPVRYPAASVPSHVLPPVSVTRPYVLRRIPETVVQKKPVLEAPDLSIADTLSADKPPQIFLNPAQMQEIAKKSPISPTNTYIDRTAYSIGATRRYEGPSAVSLTERSSGCQTASPNEQLSSGVCGITPPSLQIPSQQTANSR